MSDTVLRSRDANGTATFSDRALSGNSGTSRWRQQALDAQADAEAQERRQQDYETAKVAIKEAQKRVPKLRDYWLYLEYLRSNSPLRWERVLNELKREDPETWLKLQKHAQFRPLYGSSLGVLAADKHVAAAIGVVTGKYGGSIEKWLESTVQTEMKRQNWGPYADVLGAKATTLATKAPTYSNSRLGQYMKAEDPKLAAAGKAAAKDLEASRAAIRTGMGTAVSRVGGVGIDAGLAVLNPEVGTGITQAVLRRRLDNAARVVPGLDMDGPAYEDARRLLSQGQYGALDAMLKSYGQ